MLALMPNERILLQREGSIVIKYKYIRAKEGGKGTFYVTNMRIVFEDKKRGIILQAYPFQHELQAYRVNKSLLGGEKLAMDIQRLYEGKTIAVVAEVEFKDKKGAEEAVKAIEAMRSGSGMLLASSSSNSSKNIPANNSHSHSHDIEEEEELYDAFLETKTKYETVEVPLFEGEELKGFWHDVDVFSASYDHKGNIRHVWTTEEEGKGSKVVVTTRNAYYVTPYGWLPLSGLKEENESSAEHKGNIAYVHNFIIDGKPRHTTRLIFKTEEEAKEFVKLWWEQKRARQKGDNEKLVNYIQINMVEREEPRIVPPSVLSKS